MARVKIEIQGIEEIDLLVQKHQELLRQLSGNLCDIHDRRLELEVKLNQPPAGDHEPIS